MRKIALLGVCTLLLSGCGDIELPESFPAETLAPVTTTTALQTPLTSVLPTPTLVAESCTALQKERDNLSEAVTISVEELKSCQAENQELKNASVSTVSATKQLEKFAPFIEKYLAEGTLEEYKFNGCGGLGTVTSLAWYGDFAASMEAGKIPFSNLNRSLRETDFYSVCYSEEGGSAVFLGASNEGQSEFHMIKYDINEKTVEEATLLDGTCSSCPTKFGKRFGPYITLLSNNNTEYKYYYDLNLIDQ